METNISAGHLIPKRAGLTVNSRTCARNGNSRMCALDDALPMCALDGGSL